jgi:transcription elongation GreA/GreB family factor
VSRQTQEGKISDESPIGQSLMGKKVGDEVEVGGKKYKIEEIS